MRKRQLNLYVIMLVIVAHVVENLRLWIDSVRRSAERPEHVYLSIGGLYGIY